MRSLGTGDPIVWIPGAAGDCDLLALSIWLLRDESQSIVISPGELLSAGNDKRGFSDIADNLARVLEATGIENPILFGTGPGGLMALEYAAQFPAKVRGLILQGAAPGVEWTWTERVMMSIARRWPGTLRRVPVWLRAATLNHAPWFPPFDPSRWEFLRDNLAATPVSRFAKLDEVGSGVNSARGLQDDQCTNADH